MTKIVKPLFGFTKKDKILVDSYMPRNICNFGKMAYGIYNVGVNP
jgi:hypothetical protein